MKPKSKKGNENVSASTSASVSETTTINNPPETSVENAENEERVTIGFPMKDGKVQVERMREKTKQQLKELLADEGLKKAVSFSGATTKEESSFSTDVCENIYEGIGQVLKALVGQNSERAGELMLFSKHEKEMLAEPTSKILAKRSPAWVLKFQDEIALAVLFGSITYQKVEAAREIIRLEKAKNVTPINEAQQNASSQSRET